MANKILHVREADVTWRDTGGSALLTLTSVGSGAGRQGARHDFGSGSIAREYEWSAYLQLVATPTLGELIYVYWKWDNGTQAGNDDGTGDIVVSSIDKLRNLELLGAIEIDQATADIEMTANGVLTLKSQQGSPVFWNAAAVALTSTAAEHGFSLTPIVPEIA